MIGGIGIIGYRDSWDRVPWSYDSSIGIRLGFYGAWNDVSGRGAEAWSRGRARVCKSTLTRLTL